MSAFRDTLAPADSGTDQNGKSKVQVNDALSIALGALLSRASEMRRVAAEQTEEEKVKAQKVSVNHHSGHEPG